MLGLKILKNNVRHKRKSTQSVLKMVRTWSNLVSLLNYKKKKK